MPQRRRLLAICFSLGIGCTHVLTLAQQPAVTQPAATQPATTRPNGNATTRSITTQPGGGLKLNFVNADINAVLDELSAAAGFIVVKVVRPEGKVTLVSKEVVRPDQAIEALNTVLMNTGMKYAAIQQGRILKIVTKEAGRKMAPVRSGSDPSKIPNTDELATWVIPLKSVNAMQLRNDLTPLINTAEADFTANADSNTLLVTDTLANIKRIVEIVSALDSATPDAAEVKVFNLKFASAAAAARLITEVFGAAAQAQGGGGGGQGRGQGGGGNLGGGGGFNFGGGQGGGGRGGFGGGGGGFGGGGGGGFGGGGGGGQGRGQGGRGGQGGGAGRRNIPRVTAAADDRTNTLVVSGPEDTLAVIERVIKDLDANPSAEETVFIYRLNNAQALNVESVVNYLFNGTYSGGGRSAAGSLNQSGVLNRNTRTGGLGGGGGGGGGPGGGGGFGGRGGNGGGGGFGGTGGFGGGGRGFGGGGFGGGGFGGGAFGGGAFGGAFGGGAGGRGLTQGSLRTAQDLSGQVTIIADPDTNSLLVRTSPANFERVKAVLAELDRPVAQVLIKVLIAEVTHDKSIDLGTEFSVLNLRSSGLGQQGGTNFGIPVLGQGLVVSILESNFQATIRLLEQTGKLDVLSRPYILASDNQLASITVGQEVPFITNTRITDEGGTINTIEYQDIGILLDVIPHINPEGLVILDVAPEISALTGTTVPISETVDAPVFAKRSAQSRVGVRNGQTVVIGGLMEDRKTETIRKIPILGDIPIIGEAFKRREDKKTKTELLIFLTPHVAARPEMLGDISKEELGGTKLVPGAVYPGAFQEHQDALQRGHTPDPKSSILEFQPAGPASGARQLGPTRGGGTEAPDRGPDGNRGPGRSMGRYTPPPDQGEAPDNANNNAGPGIVPIPVPVGGDD